MNEFVLTTRWTIPAPIESVWHALHDVERWPTWWPYVRQVTEIRKGDADGVGARQLFVWATRLPYQVTFEMQVTRLKRPLLIEGEARGDLNGNGRWDLLSEGAATRVSYEWRVSADKPWMKFLAPLLRPVFVWNHNGVMRAGKEGLLRHLDAQASVSSKLQRSV